MWQDKLRTSKKEERFVEEVSERVNKKNATSALFKALRDRDFIAAEKAIIDGANVNAVYRYKDDNFAIKDISAQLKLWSLYNDFHTPLHIAATLGLSDMCILLLERGANLSVVDKERFTPLHIAALRGKDAVCNILIQKGADVNQAIAIPTFSPLYSPYPYAICPEEICNILEKHINDNKVMNNLYGYTPLHLASTMGKVGTVKLLLESGAKVDQKNIFGATPLHLGVSTGDVNIVKLLLEFGADVDQKNIFGATPLELASKGGMYNTVKLLQDHNSAMEAIDNIDNPLHPEQDNINIIGATEAESEAL